VVCSSPLAIQAADQFDSKFRAATGLHSHVVHAALVMTDCVVQSLRERRSKVFLEDELSGFSCIHINPPRFLAKSLFVT
jgi:hypothetical protein